MEGTVTTLQLAFGSLGFAMTLGLLMAGAKLSSIRSLQWLAETYTTLIRGVPELVLMLLIFFGGQVLVNAAAAKLGYTEYIDINPFVAGIFSIGLIFGAYMTETFRGAFLAVPKGQLEAGRSFGMTPLQVFWRIHLPLMIRFALPGFSNNWLVLVKSTALVSIIGLDDVVRKASLAAGATHKPFTFWMAVGMIYLVITIVSLLAQKRLERRFCQYV